MHEPGIFSLLYYDRLNFTDETMNPKSAAWLVVLLFLPACELSEIRLPSAAPESAPTREVQPPPSTPEPGCISTEPTQADIDRALDFTGGLFQAPEWEHSYHVMAGRVGVTWSNSSLGAVAYLEALIFPCGYEEPDLDAYFTDENWRIIFENYDRFEITAECKRNDGLRLYELNTKNLAFDYDTRYWAVHDTDHRIITLMLTFPIESKPLLDDISLRFFPQLPNCP
jgi:hypothetical protein